ncbi:MAG: hypothetical protein F4073_07515 [Rhodobacteraceae bacterium]|nr:hypothetical protein [Paracoccaceae bacterium]MYF45202.1 hypothetical protein [Paracoccaceae bacterium]MYI91786.1 hypothetical protein [Paracoccaceae bacterium]
MTFHQPVIKSEGITPSERHLARLADKSFLKLWAYPNPCRGPGKELCDLLVVCGPYVIIFSEKTIAWPKGGIDTAWSKWAKRAIRDSEKQARGAERWICEHPDRVYLDQKCKSPFPIDLPLKSERIFHRIVVANGASKACRDNTTGSSGSLIIRSDIKGDQHWSNISGPVRPFQIGDVDPEGSFVHIFNEYSLDIIMDELDTVGDFVDYLEKKVALVRTNRLVQADGEENLLAYYAIRTNKAGEHDFVPVDRPLVINHAHYQKYINDPRYLKKKKADRISYLWDNLIKSFTDHMIHGTNVTLGDYKFQLKKNEKGVRYMALEPRLYRRSLSEGIHGAMIRGATNGSSFRMMIKGKGSRGYETAFFIFTLKYYGASVNSQEYEEYRLLRAKFLETYSEGILESYSFLKRVIGIGCEPPGQPHGLSEDMVYAEQSQWSEEDRIAIRENCAKLGILHPDMATLRWKGQEFPDVESY